MTNQLNIIDTIKIDDLPNKWDDVDYDGSLDSPVGNSWDGDSIAFIEYPLPVTEKSVKAILAKELRFEKRQGFVVMRTGYEHYLSIDEPFGKDESRYSAWVTENEAGMYEIMKGCTWDLIGIPGKHGEGFDRDTYKSIGYQQEGGRLVAVVHDIDRNDWLKQFEHMRSDNIFQL